MCSCLTHSSKGIVPPTSTIGSLPSVIDSQFAARAHLRLESAHPALTIELTFWNVPEIEDGKIIKWGIAKSSTAVDVIDGLVELYRLPLHSVEYTIDSVEMRKNQTSMLSL